MEQLQDQSVDLFLSFDEETGFYRRHVFQYEIFKYVSQAQASNSFFQVYDLGFEGAMSQEAEAEGTLKAAMLAALAKRLNPLVQQGWMLCRYAQNRLVFCSPVEPNPELQLAHRNTLLELAAWRTDPRGMEIPFALKIGSSCFPLDCTDPTCLIENAYLARLSAQVAADSQSHGLAMVDYNANLGRLAARESELLAGLGAAVVDEQVKVMILPELNLHSNQLTGLSFFPVWQHPVYGLIGVEELYRLARVACLSGPLGEALFERTLAQYIQVRSRFGLRCGVAVSLPCEWLRLIDMDTRLLALSEVAGLNASDIELCFQEKTLPANDPMVQKALFALHRKGFKITLEGFGQGSASLTTLRSLPVSKLCIARNIVENVVTQLDDFYLISAIVSMAHSLKIKVVADSVSTYAQASALSRMNCHLGRGELFTPPLFKDTFAQWVSEVLPQLQGEDAQGKKIKKPSLLLVDDEASILGALRRLLRQDGYTIYCAGSAREAFEILAVEQIDVIMSDQRMPEMNGTEFLSKVKERYPNTVRLVLSGYTELGSVTEAINLGAIYKFLTKPWDDEQLRANLREAFQRHDIEQQNNRLKHEVETVNAELVQLNQVLELKVNDRNARLDRNNDFRLVMQEMFDQLPLAMFGVDEEGDVVTANRQACELLGCQGGLLGHEVHDLPKPLQMLIEEFMSHTESKSIDQEMNLNKRHHLVQLRTMGQASKSNGCMVLIHPARGANDSAS